MKTRLLVMVGSKWTENVEVVEVREVEEDKKPQRDRSVALRYAFVLVLVAIALLFAVGLVHGDANILERAVKLLELTVFTMIGSIAGVLRIND